MSQLAVKPTPAPAARQLPPAANEHGGDAGLNAIAAMRAALGKTSAASKFDRLSQQQKAILLTAARLRPSQYINKPLMTLTTDEREAIRHALISLVDLGRAFAAVPLSRDQFIAPKITMPMASPKQAPQREEVNSGFDEISRLAAELASEITELDKH
ncbi:hypothetical protein ACE02Z_00285 [Shewanella xiamenensis]|uniref:hypothetical protein n=1 Tax=Shewanella xiamenensis TaxID=332186 RepID=UPI00313B4ED0